MRVRKQLQSLQVDCFNLPAYTTWGIQALSIFLYVYSAMIYYAQVKRTGMSHLANLHSAK